MKPFLILMTLVALSLAASACGTASAKQANPPGGTRVAVDGGSYTNVDAKSLKQMLENKNFDLVNVHVPYAGEIANTDTFIPYNEIEQKLDQLPGDKNAMIVLYCSSGHMSSIAAQKLVALGYTNIWSLDGGMSGWVKEGFPLLKK